VKLLKVLSFIAMLTVMLSAVTPGIAFAQTPTAPTSTAPTQNIVQIASSNPRLSTLVSAVQAAGLASTLEGPGPFTVFAPTNAAFKKLGKKTLTALLADPSALSKVLLYHVAPGKLMAADVVGKSSTTTADSNLPIAFQALNGKVFVNNARILVTDIQATNGVIHVIDTVLQPPTKDIVDTLASRPNFKTLVSAVQAANLAATLKGSGPFTVFAPTNAAFNKLGKKTLAALLADPSALSKILTYHVLGSAVYAGDLPNIPSAPTVNGAPVVFTFKNNALFINRAKITVANIVATNGVIHVIDTVLQPPTKDIVDTLASRPNAKTLVSAVQAANLAATLKGSGPFTVFAPTDAAFAKLGKKTLNALLADPTTLSSILTYHVLSGEVFSPAAAKLTSAKTVNGANITISVKKGSLFINNARVVTADVLTTNGVIHVIDTVLLPPTP
jgi:transforming growth factor-beta-induced protein